MQRLPLACSYVESLDHWWAGRKTVQPEVEEDACALLPPTRTASEHSSRQALLLIV